VAALKSADPGRLATEDLNLVNNASTGRPGSSYRRNIGKDDASELQGKTGQEQGGKFHFTVSFSVGPLFVTYVEYDSSRETVVNKYERT